MGLFKRIRDILSANFSEMADQFEDPERMLKQAIREMEDSIRRATSETASALATVKQLDRELAKNERESIEWAERAGKAVDAGDDVLARRALSRKKDYDRIATALRDQHQSAKQASDTLRHQLEGMRAKLGEAKRSLATLAARQRAAEVRKKAYSQMGETPEVTLENAAFEKFERMREKVDRAEAEAEALAELQGVVCVATPLEEPPAGDDSIEAELASLKRHRSAV